jgi:phosphatidate cytidylyltransferase
MSPVLHLLVNVYGFIAVCSTVGFVHPSLRAPRGKPIRQAINSWWPPALLGGAATAFGGIVGVASFALVSAWCLHEYMAIAPASGPGRACKLVAFSVVPLHYASLAFNLAPFGVVALTVTFGVLPLVWLLSAGHAGTLTGLPRLQWGLVLSVVALSHVARLFVEPALSSQGGAGLAALLLLAVMANDAAQYVFGKAFGRHALAPRISPKKTWEGFLGGVLVTALVASAASSLVSPFHRLEAAALGAALSALGLLGDLLISGVKRDAGVKDTGAVLPGQGGVLDRCDSLLFAAPAYFYGVLQWLP